MRKRNRLSLAVAAAWLAAGPAANAALITQTLGDVDFSNGQTSIGTATFTGAGAGDPAPFNSFIGSDVNGPNFSTSFAFNYGAIADSITSAAIQIGLYDGDSVAFGNQVAAYSVDGFDLTALLNAVMEATPGASGQENYYAVALPTAALALLADGSATFSLSLQPPGSGVLGDTPFNGAGLDFATFTISTESRPTTTVPEPTSVSLLLAGLTSLLAGGALRRRRSLR